MRPTLKYIAQKTYFQLLVSRVKLCRPITPFELIITLGFNKEDIKRGYMWVVFIDGGIMCTPIRTVRHLEPDEKELSNKLSCKV